MKQNTLKGSGSQNPWAVEILVDSLIFTVLFLSFIALSKNINEDASFHSKSFNIEFIKTAPIGFAFIFFVNFFWRIWNYFIIIYILRNYVKKYVFKNMMLVRLFTNAIAWVLCFQIFFIFLINYPNMHSWGNVIDKVVLFDLNFWKLSILGLFPACIAPILTYRLTGYCFDSDFSLPPWSHGRWGFGKLAPAQVEPASAEAGSDTPVPRDTGGGM